MDREHDERVTSPLMSPTMRIQCVARMSTESSVISTVLDVIADIFNLTLSLFFLAFAIIVSNYHGLSTADHPQATRRLLSVAKIGPSIFPILFAAVLGRAAHSIFLWRLYRGERIGVLDLLADSTSLTATVTSQIRLRVFNLFGVALTLVWAWSPVGGQASFRQLTIGNIITNHTSTFFYMTNSDFVRFTDTVADYGQGPDLAQTNSVYAAAIVSSAKVKNSSQDAWGNVKIPMIEYYENSSWADAEGWYKSQATSESTSDIYSSLVGIPIAGLNSSGFIDYSFNIETEYLRLHCPYITNGQSPSTNFTYNTTGDFGGILWDYNRLPSHNYVDDPVAFNFTYFTPELIFHCGISTTYVQVEITCTTESSCKVSRVGRSKLQHPPANYTKLDIFNKYLTVQIRTNSGRLGSFNWDGFAAGFVRAFDGQVAWASMSNTYFWNPLDPWGEPEIDPSDIMFELRLNQLINTYWTAMNGQRALTGGLNPSTAYFGQDSDAYFLANVSTTTGTKGVQKAMIQTHISWTVVLVISSSIMIIAALVPPSVRIFLVQGPDLLPNMSSLATQHNRYLPLPIHGTYMGARERACLLKDVKVRFGDVESTAEHGRLAINSLDGEKDPAVLRVVKGRLYE